jgi:hypothetical protein
MMTLSPFLSTNTANAGMFFNVHEQIFHKQQPMELMGTGCLWQPSGCQ